MITVNLKPGQRRKSAGNPLKGLLDNLSVFKELSAKIKDPFLMGAVGAWVLVIAVLGLLYLNNLRQLYVLEPRLEQARSENRRFKAFLADKRRQEKIRDSLLAQITVIKSVDGDRYIWPHLLDEITKALPAYTWLIDLGVSAPAPVAQNKPAGATPDTAPPPPPPPLTFQINGRTIDIQAYTRFLRQLEASPWIMDVMPVSAQTVVEKERPVTAFTIRASYNRADSAYIRTAPFSQSVR
ncbi:MAG TPA: PilN domain-containing protein [Gemmatimonadales bacterium]|jgi:Tfp pilus assembly protein PilN|nr:PilN domain-containing protein [Gemmatimonadales bacterium]